MVGICRNIQLLRSTDFAYLIGYLKITFHWPEKISPVAVYEANRIIRSVSMSQLCNSLRSLGQKSLIRVFPDPLVPLNFEGFDPHIFLNDPQNSRS